MVGTARLANAKELLEHAFLDGVLGDFIETGVWRGGTSIFARAVQRVHGEKDARRVYVCDSFQGLPKASQKQDTNQWSRMTFLRVSLEDVRDHFERFQMLDGGVFFVKGFFSDTLPVLREHLQGDGRRIA